MTEGAEDTSSGVTRLWNSPIGDDVSFLVARANAISLARTHRALAPHGLKVRTYAVLGLAVSDARPTQRELSEFLRLDPSQIVALVDELERRGLVYREPHPNDRRVKVVSATPAGVATFVAAQADAGRATREWFEAIPEAHRRLFTELLGELANDE